MVLELRVSGWIGEGDGGFDGCGLGIDGCDFGDFDGWDLGF